MKLLKRAGWLLLIGLTCWGLGYMMGADAIIFITVP